MQLRKHSNGSIQLTRLNAWDVQTFRSLPSLADFSTDPRAEKRLLPSPAIDSDMSPELAMDWVEYVVPELRESFAENLSIVMGDLATLTPEAADPEENSNEDEIDGDDRNEEDGAAGDPGGSNSPQANASRTEGSTQRHDTVASDAPHFALTIPADHAEAWFLAMNQARIVLSQRYGIDSEHVPELARLLEAGHIEYWFQYELFVSLQGWLVEAVLDPE